MSDFGQRLKNIRREKKLSQDDFAALLGTTKQVVSRYENGQRSPKVSIVASFAERLGIDVCQLLGDGGRQASAPAVDAGAEELRRIYDALNDSARADLLKYARYLDSDADNKRGSASSTSRTA